MSVCIRHIPVLLFLLLSACASTPPQPAQIDRISAEQLSALVPAPQATLSLEEIVTLAKQGKSEDEIIVAIKQSQSRYALTPSQVLEWHAKGIPNAVLDYMQQANALAEQNAIADEINKRQQEAVNKQEKLKRERDAARLRAMDPWFYGPGFYGPGFYGYGSGFYGGPWACRPFCGRFGYGW